MIIRYANSEDIDSLAYVHSKSLKSAFKGMVSDEILIDNFSIERRKGAFLRELGEKNPITALATLNKLPIGLLSYGFSRYIDTDLDTIELWRIYLLPKYWGRNYAKELLDWGLNEMKRLGYKQVILWVVEENYRARKFYENSGFIHDGTKMQIKGNSLLEELLYYREL